MNSHPSIVDRFYRRSKQATMSTEQKPVLTSASAAPISELNAITLPSNITHHEDPLMMTNGNHYTFATNAS